MVSKPKDDKEVLEPEIVVGDYILPLSLAKKFYPEYFKDDENTKSNNT